MSGLRAANSFHLMDQVLRRTGEPNPAKVWWMNLERLCLGFLAAFHMRLQVPSIGPPFPNKLPAVQACDDDLIPVHEVVRQFVLGCDDDDAGGK